MLLADYRLASRFDPAGVIEFTASERSSLGVIRAFDQEREAVVLPRLKGVVRQAGMIIRVGEASYLEGDHVAFGRIGWWFADSDLIRPPVPI